MKLAPKDFVETYYPFALASEQSVGISAVFTLAQAALESAWGEKAPGNNFFGIKALKNTPENERQCFTTQEVIDGQRRTVCNKFMKYNSPEEGFIDHAQFFLRNPRYAEALKVRHNAHAFAEAVAKAGYATDPDYANILKRVIKTIQLYV